MLPVHGPFVLIVPLVALVLSGCIDPGYAEEDDAPALPDGWTRTGESFASFEECDSSYAVYAQDCDSEAETALPLDALPVGAVCLDAFPTHRVYADAERDRLILELFADSESAYRTGVYYQPGYGNSMYGVGWQLFQWTFPENAIFVALDASPGTYLIADHHFVRHGGVNVEAGGAALGKAFSVDWLVLSSGGFEPVYELSDSSIHGHFKGATPIQLVGEDFTLRIEHADLAPDAGTSAHGGRGC